jgi:hypothetical protein
MERTDESVPDDVPAPIAPLAEEKLPEAVKEAFAKSEASASTPQSDTKIKFSAVTLTELLSLYAMEEEIALEIKKLIDTKAVSSFEELKGYDCISKEQYAIWSKLFI